ncbi:MAG: 1-(5-phosphoribosyl)-5-((5-phosphoribosylamino)methylideneamino)imidazole-4-carboxamide isomerase, partial [Calditrichaeota bacterium]
FTPERIGISLDVRDQYVRIAGWQRHTGMPPLELVSRYAPLNLRHVVFTNIARDGMSAGLDLEGAKNLAQQSGLSVVASGGVASLQDIRMARKAGLAGVIIGRALYDGQINLPEALQC